MVAAYIHEVGLYGTLQGQPPSATRIGIMFECLASIRQYISNVLTISTEAMSHWTAMHWRALNYSIMLTARISVTLNSAEPNTESSMRLDRIITCLDELIMRTRSIHEMTRTPEGSSHFFQQLSDGWDTIRSWLRVVRERASAQAAQIQSTRTFEGINPGNPILEWNRGQDLPWTGFESTNLWAAEDSWLRM
jgi:hypothetical protein